MSIIIKPNMLKFKDEDGNYVGVNAVAERTAKDIVTDIKEQSQAIVDKAQKDIDSLEDQQNTIYEKIASTLENGTDTTLTLSGVSADSKAVGDILSEHDNELVNIKDNLENNFNQLNFGKIDGAYVEDGYLFLTSNGEVVVGNLGPFSGGGGSGGGGASNNAILTVTNTSGWLAKTIAEDSDCIITLNWSSLENDLATGDGSISVLVNNTTKATINAKQGDVSINVKDYLGVGSNSVKLKVYDAYGNVKIMNFSIKVLSVSISSTFDSSMPISDAFSFTFTPVGALKKTIHFLVDGVEIGTMETSLSGRQLSYNIPKQSHGSHTLKVYFDAEVEGQVVTSNTLLYDIICISDGTDTIITSDFVTTEVTQYTAVNIEYYVYNPSSMMAEVDLIVNGETISHQTVDRTKQTWTYRFDTVGGFNLKIKSGTTEKLFVVNVTSSGVTIEAETEALQLYLSSYGRSNNEDTPSTWSYGDLSSILTDFNYKTNGWVLDEDKNTVLRLSGDARVEIPFKIFKDDFRTTGKTIEFEFATREVLNYDSTIISCLDDNRGLFYTAQEVLFASEQSKIGTQYKENEHVRLTFVIEKRTENRLIYVYINGVMCGAMQYPVNDNFSQQNPVNITIGSNECTLDIYCIRVYNNDLTRFQVLNNWIADTQDVNEKLERYTRNDIFDEYGKIVIDKLPKYTPYLILRCPELPQYKGDKKIVSGSFTNPLYPLRDFTFENAQFDVQGTSSAGYARKNYKGKFKGGFVVNGEESSTYAMNDDAIPTSTFTFKADVASSEGANNVELVKLYNDTCTYKTPPQQENPNIRQGIDGFPIVVFWDNGESVTFLGKYNFNNDKGTEEVYGFNEGDESWEFLNNTSDRSLFRSADFSTDDWQNDFEARYPEENTDCSNLQEVVAWVESTENDLVKFKSEFKDHFELDAMLYYYVFTETFLMVDSRAKNMFLTKIGGSKWFMLPYDFDTAIGINNEGTLAFSYNLEDIDQVDGADVYNGQNSILWVNFRRAYREEIAGVYAKLRSAGTFSYDSVIKRFTDHQKIWSEAIFNEDAYFKYLLPLIEEGTSAYLSMLQGDKDSQRKWWCYNRFKYLDSKYIAGESTKDIITLRGYAKDNITVTPYADLYATIKYGSYIVQKRANRNESYVLECPLSNVNDTEIYIYNCSQLSSIGDISGLKVGYAEFSLATKLQSLKIGDSKSSYSNTNLKELYLGNNVLLKTLDVRNCPNLTMAVDLSGCTNIEEVYFDGTSVTGILLPNGGMLRVLHLPNTITSLNIRNQKNLTELVIPSLTKVSTLWVENVTADALSLENVARGLSANSRVRLLGFKKTTFDSIDDALEVLALYDKMQGLDENGNNVEKAQLSGEIHVPNLTGTQLANILSRYPDIKVTYDHITSYCYFYSDDGATLLDTVECIDGADATFTKTNPTKTSTAQYTFTFSGWSLSIGGSLNSNALKNVEADRKVYAYYNKTVRTYTCYFYNGSTLLQTVNNVPYGSTPKYTGATPVSSEGSAEDYPFEGWSPALSVGITGDTTYKAVFGSPYEEEEITDSWEEIIQACKDGTYKTKYKIGNYKLFGDSNYKAIICGIDVDELENGLKSPLTWWTECKTPQIPRLKYDEKIYGDGFTVGNIVDIPVLTQSPRTKYNDMVFSLNKNIINQPIELEFNCIIYELSDYNNIRLDLSAQTWGCFDKVVIDGIEYSATRSLIIPNAKVGDNLTIQITLHNTEKIIFDSLELPTIANTGNANTDYYGKYLITPTSDTTNKKVSLDNVIIGTTLAKEDYEQTEIYSELLELFNTLPQSVQDNAKSVKHTTYKNISLTEWEEKTYYNKIFTLDYTMNKYNVMYKQKTKWKEVTFGLYGYNFSSTQRRYDWYEWRSVNGGIYGNAIYTGQFTLPNSWLFSLKYNYHLCFCL